MGHVLNFCWALPHEESSSVYHSIFRINNPGIWICSSWKELCSLFLKILFSNLAFYIWFPLLKLSLLHISHSRWFCCDGFSSIIRILVDIYQVASMLSTLIDDKKCHYVSLIFNDHKYIPLKVCLWYPLVSFHQFALIIPGWLFHVMMPMDSFGDS